MNSSQDPIANILETLQEKIKKKKFKGISVQRLDQNWIEISLHKEERTLWLGYEAGCGFFTTIDRSFPPKDFFGSNVQLMQTADLVLSGFYSYFNEAEIKEQIRKEVEKEISRLRPKIEIKEYKLKGSSSQKNNKSIKYRSSSVDLSQLSQFRDSDVVLIQFRHSPGSTESFIQLSQDEIPSSLERGFHVMLTMGEKNFIITATSDRERGGIIKAIKRFLLNVPFISKTYLLLSKTFRSIFNTSPRKNFKKISYWEATALQDALKVLSNPKFKRTICSSCLSDQIDRILDSVLKQMEIKGGIVGAMAVSSIFNLNLTPPAIAFLVLLVSQFSLSVYCGSEKQ